MDLGLSAAIQLAPALHQPYLLHFFVYLRLHGRIGFQPVSFLQIRQCLGQHIGLFKSRAQLTADLRALFC